MPMTPTEMIRLLKKNGFQYIKSNNGSHQKFHNPSTKRTVTVPVHDREMSKGLEQTILKQAGLK